MANLGGTIALTSGHPIIGGLGLAVSATCAGLLYANNFNQTLRPKRGQAEA